MRGWSEMESDDGEMSGRSGSSGGLRTETNLCLSHSALQSLSSHLGGQLPPQISRLQWRTVTSDQSLLSQSVNRQLAGIDS